MGMKELRDELRELRKTTGHRPISKMRKDDISKEIERLRVGREETPAVASVPSAPLKKSMSAVENIKEAKAKEFPHKPETTIKSGKTKSTTAVGRGAADAGDKKKKARRICSSN